MTTVATPCPSTLTVSAERGRPSLRAVAYEAVKRCTDIVGASILLMCLAPVFVLVSVLIKLTDGGSVLFVQTRVGRRGRRFAFYKFRSMVEQADSLKVRLSDRNLHSSGITFKMRKDPRVTWIGRFIRKTSIDELPQLWNVLRGDMSLVGPRPAVPSEVDRYSEADRRRLGVLPGLTCIWQVSGRADLAFDQQVQLDIEYIEKRNVWLDLKLLLLTVPAVLSARGAY